MSPFHAAYSQAANVEDAVRELHEALVQADTVLVMFFCSGCEDLNLLAEYINQYFHGIPVLGCTAAGNLGAGAYGGRALAGVSFPSGVCNVSVAGLKGLQAFDSAQARYLVGELSGQLERQQLEIDPAHCFAWQLVDGMSGCEEVVTRQLQGALGLIPLVGGSAGDDMHFNETYVFWNGAFHSDSVAVALVHTELPFQIFMTQHFEPMQDRLVVTEADAKQRIVKELNGLPAAQEYARCLGVDASVLDSALFADRPVVVSIGNKSYVRSIQRVLPDGSLRFYCAIEEGVVLRIAQGVDLLGNLKGQFSLLHERIGPPALILACDCALRRLEVERLGIHDDLQQLLALNHVVGFCSYGEQYRGVHINQTLTGIAIGWPASAAPGVDAAS